MDRTPTAVTWGRLQTFLAVYDAGSVRAAAQHLHVTPPAVSAAISALDEGFGVTLFARSGRGIAPTDAAHALAAHARSLLGLLDETAGAVREAERGRLRIGSVATAGEYVLPALVASFARTHPDVELSMSVLRRDELFAAAGHHELDVVVSGRPPQGSGLRPRARRANRLVVVAAPRVDIERSPWLLTGSGSGTRQTALELIARLGCDPVLLTLGTSGACVAAAREGLGVTLVHEQAASVDLSSGALVAVELPGTPLERPWHLCTSARPSAVAALFVGHVCSVDLVGARAAFSR